MDWDLALNRWHAALLRVVVGLFAVAGIKPGGSVDVLARHRVRAVLFVLKSAEAAGRRLIVMRAHVDALRGVPVPKRGDGVRLASFPLLDSLKRYGPDGASAGSGRRVHGVGPRLTVIGMDDDPDFSLPEDPEPDDLISAARMCKRLNALLSVLNDLPRHAQRLARWQARRAAGPRLPGKRCSPLRPGWPPGHRKRRRHPVDEILSECHAFARNALEPRNTS